MELQLNGLADVVPSSAATATQPAATMKLVDMLSQAANVFLSAKQQKDLQKLNLERARQGLPPLDTAAYAEASAPVMKVQGGVDAGTRKIIWSVGLGTLGLLGLGLFIMSGKRR